MISYGDMLDALRSKGYRVREEGREARAQCPAHDGKNLNLAVGRTDRGAALVYCHSRQCDWKDVFSALDLKGGSAPSGTGRLMLREHAYHGRDGRVLYRKKKFLVRKDDGFTYEWITEYPDGTKVPREERPLYRVRELAGEKDLIVITEGEKDADTLAKDGVTATTGGSAGTWEDRWTDDVMHAARIRIVADNDEAGLKGAASIYQKLSHHPDVRVLVPLPGYNDVTDMYKADLSFDDLIAADVAEISDEPSEVGGLATVDWEPFWTEPLDVPEWLVHPLVLVARTTNFHAAAGEGKSELVLYLMVLAALRGVRVLWLDREMTKGDLRERLEEMGFGPGTDLSNLDYVFYPDLPPLDTPEGGDALAWAMQERHHDVAVLDSLSKFIEGDEIDNQTHTNMFIHTTQKLRVAGRALLAIDHMGKDQEKGARGGSAKKDNVDLHLALERTAMGARIFVKKKRHSWIAERYDIHRGANPLRYEVVGAAELPAGVHALVKTLDDLDVPLDAGRPAVQSILREHDKPVGRNADLSAAIKYRQERTDGFVPQPKGEDDCAFNCGRQATRTVEVPNDRARKTGVKKQRVCDECQTQARGRAA